MRCFPPFDKEDALLHQCMVDGDSTSKQPEKSKRGGTNSRASSIGRCCESLATIAEGSEGLLRQLQSDVDKLKHAEWKRREAVRKAREAAKAAAEAEEYWLTPERRATSCSEGNHGRKSKQTGDQPAGRDCVGQLFTTNDSNS